MTSLFRPRTGKVEGRARLAAGIRPAGGGWLAMVFAALVALSVQSFVVQTHVHLRGLATQSGATQPGASVAAPVPHRAHSSEPLDCPACRQLARAGACLLPVAALPALSVATFGWFAVLPRLVRHARTRSHAWLSRGPPARPAAPRS